MRFAWILGGVTGMLLLAESVFAEPPFEDRAVTREVDVRSGPSPEFYATSRLRPGDRVQALDDKAAEKLPVRPSPGWVAIKPPHGSFSWIQDRFLEHKEGGVAIVLGTDVPVRIGSSVVNDPPRVQQVKLQRHTLLVVLGGKGVTDQEGLWLPIEPPLQEVRYVPADALRVNVPVQTVSTAPPAPAVGATPLPTSAVDPLWTQAEQAEKDGNIAEAIRLYDLLGQQKAQTDHELALQCYNRSHHLREGYRTSAPSAAPPTRPTEVYYPNPNDNRTAPVPPSPAAAPPARATSQYTYVRDNPTPFVVPPVPVTAPQPNPPTPPAGQWSGPGRLLRSAVRAENGNLYVLQLNNGELRYWYVTAAPGVLEPYVNRNVNLYGTVIYHSSMRTYFMTVSQVAVIP
jgi:hypothetical protein